MATAAALPRPLCLFSKPLQWLPYDDLAAIAAEAGFDGLDLPVRPGGHVLPERVADDLPRAVEAARKAGLAVPLATTAITSASDPLAAPVLRAARAAGITHYRMGPLAYRPELGPARTLEAYRPQLRDLAALNAEIGLHGAYQNHAGTRVGGPVWDVWLLVRDLDPRWIGCQYDIRHAVVEGGTAWPLAFELLAPHVRTTVAKDFEWRRAGERSRTRWQIANVPLGEGMVDWPAYLALVKRLGVAGPLSVHFEYAPVEGGATGKTPAERRRDALAAMKRDMSRLRALLAAAGL